MIFILAIYLVLIHTVFGSVSSRPNTLHYVCIFILTRHLPFIHSVFVAILTRCLPLIHAIFFCFPPDVSLPYGTCVDYTCSAVYVDGTVNSKKVYCNGEYTGCNVYFRVGYRFAGGRVNLEEGVFNTINMEFIAK